MITMTCCNNSEQIGLKTYLTKVVSINPIKKIIIDIQINACKINKIQLGFVFRRF